MKTVLSFSVIALVMVACIHGNAYSFSSGKQQAQSGCCGTAASQQDAKTEEKNAKDPKGEFVCPLFPYMNHGTYCSYYAVLREGCFVPTNYDSSNCNLTSNCQNNGQGCLLTLIKRNDHPGNKGYGKPGEARVPRSTTFPSNPSQNDLTVTPLDSFVIKFKLKPGSNSTVSAQIFLADVKPKQGNYKSETLARGTEIEAGSGIVRHDYTDLEVHKDPVDPERGLKHSFIYKYYSHQHNKVFEIPIVTFNETPGHEQ